MHLYLQPSSCHIIRSIPYNLALHIRRICTNMIPTWTFAPMNSLTDSFDVATRRPPSHNRSLRPNQCHARIPSRSAKVIQKSDRVPLVVIYHTNLLDHNGIIRKHWTIFQSHPHVNNPIPVPELPIIRAARLQVFC